MPYAKGQSGNPGGRPKAVLPNGKTLAEAAREHCPAALQAIVDALAIPELRFAAAKELLDRGFGKPAQAVELTGAEGGPIQHVDMGGVSEAALRELAAAEVVTSAADDATRH